MKKHLGPSIIILGCALWAIVAWGDYYAYDTLHKRLPDSKCLIKDGVTVSADRLTLSIMTTVPPNVVTKWRFSGITTSGHYAGIIYYNSTGIMVTIQRDTNLSYLDASIAARPTDPLRVAEFRNFTGSHKWTYLDASISSRSTFAGGAVTSVTAPVTVGTNNDKTGYSLAVSPPTAAQIDSELTGTHGSGSWTGFTNKTGFHLSYTERMKLAAAQPDYAPAKPGDAMTVTGGTVDVATHVTDPVTTGSVAIDYNNVALAVWGSPLRNFTTTGTAGRHLNDVSGLVLPFTPTAPSPGIQTLYGYVKMLNGNAATGVIITAVITSPQKVSGAVLSNQKTAASTNSSGYFELFLVKGSRAVVAVGSSYSKTLTVTDDNTKDLSSY